MAPSWIFTCFLVCCCILQFEQTFAVFVNVARDKRAYQSSYLSGYQQYASRATDGVSKQIGYSFILTDTGQVYTWWEVDLEKTYFIHEVKIYFRTDYKLRRNGVQVYTNTRTRTSNTGYLCGTVTGKPDGSNIPDVMSINCDVNARYVTIYQETDNGGSTALDFLEVEVYACELDVKYGTTCDKLCNSRHCAVQSSSCNVQTGDCDSGTCQQGWTGADCTTVAAVCETGVTYGANCVKLCSNRHCASTVSSCNTQTGSCDGGMCQSGWTGVDCAQACTQGDNYGANCNKNCRDRHCVSLSPPCSIDTGDCGNEGCSPGWKGVDCTQRCSGGTYGSACSLQCSARHCEGDSTCDHITGGCVNGCRAGWTSTDCTTACSNGNYGLKCTKYCNRRHCLSSSSCNKQTGACDAGGCIAGWMGVDCAQACVQGVTYGSNCIKSCAARHCDSRYTSQCPADTGKCSRGCDPRWNGDDCTQACIKGDNYGANCNKNCRDRHCVSSSAPCSTDTGDCGTKGCSPGWTGVDCTQQCSFGKYGEGCLQECIDRHCYGGQRCDHPVTGQCVDGCIAGWQGVSCSEVKTTDLTTVSPQKDSESTIVALSTVIGVLILFVIIQVIVNIRLVLVLRRSRGSSGPSVSFSNKPNNSGNQSRKTTTPSSVYEAADGETNVGSPQDNLAHTPTQHGQTSEPQHDYVNSSRPAERSQENVNHYDRLDVDVIGEGSPYSKIED